MPPRLKPPQVGDQFGRWTVIGEPALRGNYWQVSCRCECGRERPVKEANLRNDRSQSCGCIRADQVRDENDGRSHTSLYHRWRSIRDRCARPNAYAFQWYGGRGITCAPEWDVFDVFRDWAYANGYSEELEIDRIDNDGNYEPGNCRWVTSQENQRNRRSNRWIEAFGEQKILSAWPEDDRCVVCLGTLWRRLSKGEAPESAITRPVLKKSAAS